MDTALHRIEVAHLLRGSSFGSFTGAYRQYPPVEVFGILEHDGEVRELVLGLKYAGETRHAARLAEFVASAVRAEIGVSGVDVLTWAPTTDARRISRGFDQAELLARHVGALCGLRPRRVLRRTNSGNQTSSGRAERMSRPRFVARPGIGGHILVVDDVVTTGSTFVAAARALMGAGAGRVTCIAPTWTPSRCAVSRSDSSR